MVEIALVLHVVLFAGLVFLLVSRGFMNIYSGLFIYSIFHFMAFVQRPVVVYLFDLRRVFDFLTYFPTDSAFIQTLVVADLGALSFTVGYLAAIRFTPISPKFEAPSFGDNDRAAFGLALLILAPLIVYSMFLTFTMRQAYGAEVLDELSQLNLRIDPTTGTMLYVDSTAYIVDARNFALPFATLLIILYRGKVWTWFPLLLCSFITLQTGSRWPLVISAVVLLLLVSYLHKRKTFELRHYVVVILVLAAFVAVGHNRDAFVRFLLTGNLDFNLDLTNSSFGDHPDFAQFDCLSYIIAKVPDVSTTYSYFTQYLGLLTQPVPRAFWADKPVGSPIMLVNLDAYGRFSPNVPTLVGDGWMSLGYLGVVLTTGPVGAFYGWLYRLFCAKRPSIYFFCAYFWMLALLLQWARDGGYTIISNFLFFSTGPVLFAYVLNRLVFGVRSNFQARHLS